MITSVAMSADDRYIVYGCEDKSLKIMDYKIKQDVHVIKNAHKDRISAIALGNDGRFMVSSSWDKSIKIFDLIGNEEVHRFKDTFNGNFKYYRSIFNDNRWYYVCRNKSR